MSNTSNCYYDYQNKCDCSEDDKCGCTYPNNMAHNYSSDCFTDDKAISSHTEQTATIGKTAPDFTASAILGNNTLIEHFNLHKYIDGHNAVLFFYPEDFSFTCPSELLMLNQELSAFTQRNTKILAISTDSIFTHIAWKQLPPQKDGISDISFPLIADINKEISKTYKVLNKYEQAHRVTFIIDTDKTIRYICLNDNSIWRTPDEVIRIIDIINQKNSTNMTCPQGWKQNFPHERPEALNIIDMYTQNDQ